FVVSDWNSVTEMIAHGYCADARNAAYRSATAGLDMEMTSKAYEENLMQLIKDGKVSEKELDEMVRNILRIKFRLGLFENPYVDRTRDNVVLSQPHLDAAKEAATQSLVLLKNEKQILPLSKNISKVAVIGPLADAPHEQLGTWIFDGEAKHSRTPLTAIQEYHGKAKVLYNAGLSYSRDKSKKEFANAAA